MFEFPMIKWAKDLFPICRSVTGEGTRKTLSYFEKLNPEFKRIKFKTGQKVFDWVIPKEWNIQDAYIEHESGKRFAEFKKCNLHVVGYSTPVNKKVSKKELLNYIYTQKDQPDSIPYVTSYYKERWGFCLSENEKNKLPEGNYKVVINSNLKKGNLDISHAIFKGKMKKEIFFSSYVCHPSMANNELSGPVLLNAIMRYIKSEHPKSKYTYRFVLHPETIGSIAYLSRFMKIMKSNILCGFNLSCVGDERAYSYVSSRKGNTLADDVMKAALIGLSNVKKYSFLLDRASDERQYCAPKIDLPFCAFSRSREYPEYHTNKDNFDVVTQKGLTGSFAVIKKIIDAVELGIYPITNMYGEPNLGKRGLYPTLSQKDLYEESRLRMHLIAYSDGKTSIFKIADMLNKPLEDLCKEYSILKSKKVLS